MRVLITETNISVILFTLLIKFGGLCKTKQALQFVYYRDKRYKQTKVVNGSKSHCDCDNKMSM